MSTLGFSSQRLTTVLRQIEARHTKERERSDRTWLDQLQPQAEPEETVNNEAEKPNRLTVQPWLWCASNKQSEQGLFRLHTLMDHIRAGRPWLSIEELKQALVETAVFRWDTLQRAIKRGDGVRWCYVAHQQRLYAYSHASVAANMGLTAADVGRSSTVDIDLAYAGLEPFNTAVYAAWLASMNKENPRPLSRATQSELTGLSPRTLRKYTAANPEIRREANYCIMALWGERETAVWESGSAGFKFRDRKGKLGKRGGLYVARELPSTYHTKAPIGSKWKMKRIRRKLAVLGGQGGLRNGERPIERRYFSSAKEAFVQGGEVAYWPIQNSGIWRQK